MQLVTPPTPAPRSTPPTCTCQFQQYAGNAFMFRKPVGIRQDQWERLSGRWLLSPARASHSELLSVPQTCFTSGTHQRSILASLFVKIKVTSRQANPPVNTSVATSSTRERQLLIEISAIYSGGHVGAQQCTQAAGSLSVSNAQ
jgi:hypothetical protein